MTSKAIFDSTFEPALIKEMYQFGEIKYFKEGHIVHPEISDFIKG